WQHVLPPSTRTDTPDHLTIPVHVPHGSSVVVVVADQQGQEELLEQVGDNSPAREVNGVLTGLDTLALGQLTPGRCVLRAPTEDGSEASGELVIGPIETDAPADEDALTEEDAPAQVDENLPGPESASVESEAVVSEPVDAEPSEPEPAQASAPAEDARAENDAG